MGPLFCIIFCSFPFYVGYLEADIVTDAIWVGTDSRGTKRQVVFVTNLIFPLSDDVMIKNDYEMIVKIMWD